MKTITKYSLRALTLAVTLSLGATASLAATAAQAKPAKALDAAATQAAPLTAELQQLQQQQQLQRAGALAQSGREAMSFIVAARQLLSDQHSEEAHQYLEKAKGLLTELNTKISAEEDNSTGLLPIYSQLGLKEKMEISDSVKQQLQNIYPDLIRGKHQQVVEALKTVGIELQYRFVDMPVAGTLGNVESALKSLSAKDTKQASQALAAAQQGLIQDSIIINESDISPAG